MRTIKVIGGFFLIVGVAFTLLVLYAGTNLIVENASGKKIQSVEIKYGRGAFSTNNLPDKEIRKKFLGKIGEGSNFDVQWHDESGITRQAQFSVYFHDNSLRQTIRIRILPNGKAELYDGKRLNRPMQEKQIT